MIAEFLSNSDQNSSSSFQLSFRVENADTSEKKLKQMILEFLNNSDQNSDKSINISIKK